MKAHEVTSSKKKEINSIKTKVKFRGLRLWPKTEILKMCQASYPQLKLINVIGFTKDEKDREMYIIEGQEGNLIITDIG